MSPSLDYIIAAKADLLEVGGLYLNMVNQMALNKYANLYFLLMFRVALFKA